MKIKEITLTKHKKIGLPGYSSIDVGMSITEELDPNSPITLRDTVAQGFELLDEYIEAQLAKEGVDPKWIRVKNEENKK